EEADRMSDRILVAIIITLGFSMLVSLFHLGNPMIAFRTVARIATSWLSREILAGVVFTTIAFAFVIMQWFKIRSSGLRNLIAIIAALVGVVFVYFQSMIYMLDTQPAWNTLATPIAFFTSSLILGVMAIGAALVANYSYIKVKNPDCAEAQCELLNSTIRWIAITSIVLLGVEFVVMPVYLASLAKGSSASLMSLELMAGQFSLAFILRLVLGFIGAGILAVFMYQNATSASKQQALEYLAYTSFALVLIAEVLARFIFYATHQGIGI
ncbi:MAG: dimethyl sulfoxide reductase anchor subunit, partial [Candidatus Bathyarchaeota archaeon]|nr:dimethyl sulfoxide reductase anchor subunit [Candidatus Bathyarchaeota archaeon]